MWQLLNVCKRLQNILNLIKVQMTLAWRCNIPLAYHTHLWNPCYMWGGKDLQCLESTQRDPSLKAGGSCGILNTLVVVVLVVFYIPWWWWWWFWCWWYSTYLGGGGASGVGGIPHNWSQLWHSVTFSQIWWELKWNLISHNIIAG